MQRSAIHEDISSLWLLSLDGDLSLIGAPPVISDPVKALNDLYKRPGFLLRRAHQICVSLFLEETASLGVTTTQYGALVILRYCEGLDRIALSKRVGLDRTTTAIVVRKLQEKGLVVLVNDVNDRRRNIIVLTARGERLLGQLGAPAQQVRDKALSIFSESEAQEFVQLLARISDVFNDQTRAPLFQDIDQPATRTTESEAPRGRKRLKAKAG